MQGRVLGAAQTVPVRRDVAANVAEHIKLVALAGQLGARVLVFPELSLTGYEMTDAVSLAFTEGDERLQPLANAAQQHEMALVVGAPVKVADALHIAAFILGPCGERSVYTKHYLGAFPESARVDGDVPPAEATVFTKGDLDPLMEFDGHPAAVAVCADANHPEHAARAAARGASTYLASSFVIPSEFDSATANLESHAKQHGMAVVFSNYGGGTGGLASAGQSGVCAPDGTWLGRLGQHGSGVIVASEREGEWEVNSAYSK